MATSHHPPASRRVSRQFDAKAMPLGGKQKGPRLPETPCDLRVMSSTSDRTAPPRGVSIRIPDGSLVENRGVVGAVATIGRRGAEGPGRGDRAPVGPGGAAVDGGAPGGGGDLRGGAGAAVDAGAAGPGQRRPGAAVVALPH